MWASLEIAHWVLARRRLGLILGVAALLCASSEVHAYDWPMDSDNNPGNGLDFETQHTITSTLGEYRTGHFHEGVDIRGPGWNVYAIEPGIALVEGLGVNVGHFRYFHLDSIFVGDSTQVQQHQRIGRTGTVAPNHHLHLQEASHVLQVPGNVLPPGGHWLNPLREGGLTPFNDFAQPIIHEVRVYRQGTTTQLQGDSLVHLHGPVDVWVDAYDPRTSATGQGAGGCCGVYRLTVEFRRTGAQVGNAIEHHWYDQCPDNNALRAAYAEGTSTGGPLRYWATNDPFERPYDKYWNTRQQTSSAWDVDAQFNAHALYPDGPIEIRVIARDIRGNQSQPYIVAIP